MILITKRVLILVLALCMVVSLFPISVKADTTEIASGTGDMTDYSIYLGGDAPHRNSNGGTQYAVFEADDAFVYLETLEISASNRYTGNQGDSFIKVLGTRNGTVDIHGNKMERGLEAWIARWNFMNEISWAWVEYELDAQYTKLSGKLTIISDCYNSKNFDSTIEILGDGILLHSASLKPGMEVTKVDVDISEVNTLRIYVYDNVAVKGGTSFGLWDFAVSSNDGLVEECDHRWDSGIETKAPTCTEGGEITYTCELCGETKIEDTLPLGHDYVDRTCSHCGKREFILAYDVWNFDNSYATYGSASEGYYISYSDHQRLISNLTETERYALLIEETQKKIGDKGAISFITQKLSNYNVDNAFSDEQCVDWGGSCYGMSTWVCLSSYGIRNASDIDGETQILNKYILTELMQTSEVESAINYYHFQQKLPNVLAFEKEFTEKTQVEQLTILERMGKNAQDGGSPFLICYRYYREINPDGSCDTTKPSGHAVVGYGWEEIAPRKIVVQDTNYTYNYRILVYDCADPANAKGDWNVYYNDDGIWCIPGKNIVSDKSNSTTGKRDNADLGIVTNDSSVLNGIDYNSGECTPIVAIATMKTAADATYTIEGNECTTVVSGFTVTSDTDDHGVVATVDYNATTEGTMISTTSTAILPDADSYTVRSEEDSMVFTFKNENYLTDCLLGSSGSMTFANDGTATLLADESALFYLNFVANDGCYDLPWYQVEIAGENAQMVSTEKTDEGIVVRSDNLDAIIVAVTDDNGITIVSGSTESNAILISENNGNPALYEDTDGDGTFENDVTHIHYYGNPDFNWTNENTCTATFMCVDGDDTQTISCTVTSSTTPATETEEGVTTYTATVEFGGQIYTDTMDTKIPATGHSFGEWTETKAATCTEKGEESRSCACGKTEIRKTDALGHKWIDASAVIKQCERCGHTEGGYRILLNEDEFGSADTVWIEGLPYPVQDNGVDRYVELPTEDDCYMVTYTYHVGDAADVHTQYPTGMKVYKISDGQITYIPELDNLLQYSGASIRITGKKGIRMITSLTKTNKTALTGKGLAGFKLLEYGTALCFAHEIPQGDALVLGRDFTRSNYAYKKGVADPVFASTKDLIQYTNVLVGFSLDQCKDDIAMRPYIILEDAAGNQITLYGGTIYRSIGYIAYQNRTVFKPKTASYNYVWELIHHVYGDKYDADYKG